MARDAAALDLLQLGKGDAFEAKARRVRAEREAAGVGDSCAERQQQTAPPVDVTLNSAVQSDPIFSTGPPIS